MENLRIGLIDDEEAPLILLSDIISMIPGYSIEFSTTDPHLGLKLILENCIDILITDILIPGLGGLEISKQIAHLNIPVIICSAYDKFGVDGFKVNAVHFVLKPPGFLEVSDALHRAKKLLERDKIPNLTLEGDFVLFKEHGEPRHLLIKPAEIQYIEQKERFSMIVLDSGQVIKTLSKFFITMEKIERPYMIRIHRSFAINFLKVNALEPTICHLSNKHKIPIGKEFRQQFQAFMESKTVV